MSKRSDTRNKSQVTNLSKGSKNDSVSNSKTHEEKSVQSNMSEVKENEMVPSPPVKEFSAMINTGN